MNVFCQYDFSKIGSEIKVCDIEDEITNLNIPAICINLLTNLVKSDMLQKQFDKYGEMCITVYPLPLPQANKV